MIRLGAFIDPKKRQRVLDAIRKGDPSLLKKPGKVGVDPLVEKSSKQLARKKTKKNSENGRLRKGAHQGNLDKVKDALAKGACVDGRNTHGETALMIAAKHGRKDVVEFLLSERAGINAISKSGWTALMAAAISDRKDVVEFLLNAGAAVNLRKSDTQTVLRCVVSSRRICKDSVIREEIIELLKQHGAVE
jgi:ankyrin repeat protein